MPCNPNQGPCSVTGCENSGSYRNFNKTVYAKSINSGTFLILIICQYFNIYLYRKI